MVIVEDNKQEIVIRLSFTEGLNLYEDLEEKQMLNTSSDELMEKLEGVVK